MKGASLSLQQKHRANPSSGLAAAPSWGTPRLNPFLEHVGSLYAENLQRTVVFRVIPETRV